MTPEKYVVRAKPRPVGGMTHEIAREGARWPVAAAATPYIADICAKALTQASAMAAASRGDVTEDAQALADHERRAKGKP